MKQEQHIVHNPQQFLSSRVILKFAAKREDGGFRLAIILLRHLVERDANVIERLLLISVILCEHGAHLWREDGQERCDEVKEADECVFVFVKKFEIIFTLLSDFIIF